MKTLNNFDEALEYVNKLGIVNRYMPIAWRQMDLCNIVKRLEQQAGSYPFKARYCQKLSRQWRGSFFEVVTTYNSTILKVWR